MNKATITSQLPKMPDGVAEEKYRRSKAGWVIAVFGGFMAVASFGLVVAVTILTKTVPDKWLLGFAAILLVAGIFTCWAGAHMASGEVSRAAIKSVEREGGAVAKTVLKIAKAFRGKNGQ